MWLHVPSEGSPSAPGSANSNSGFTLLSETAIAPSVTSRGKPMPPPRWSRAWRTGGWIRLLSGTTCSASTVERGVALWIASLRDSPANPPRSPGDEGGSTTLAGSGLTSPRSWLTWPRASSSSRTSPASSASTTATDSPPCWARWPRSGSLRAGVVTAHPTWARPTAASACSSWPTATAEDGECSGHRPGLTGASQTLTTASRQKWWPTPDASLMNDGEDPEHFETRRLVQMARRVNGNGRGSHWGRP